MALQITDKEVERLVEQITQLTGESETEAIRVALSERYQQLASLTGMVRSGSQA